MSDYIEMASRLRDRERHDYTIAELAELRGAHDRLRAVMREASIELAESIRLQQRALAALARALGAKPRLRPVPPPGSSGGNAAQPPSKTTSDVAEMAVWDAAEAEKR